VYLTPFILLRYSFFGGSELLTLLVAIASITLATPRAGIIAATFNLFGTPVAAGNTVLPNDVTASARLVDGSPEGADILLSLLKLEIKASDSDPNIINKRD
jgi:hypothetical protein